MVKLGLVLLVATSGACFSEDDDLRGTWHNGLTSTREGEACMGDVVYATIGDSTVDFALEDGVVLKAEWQAPGLTLVRGETSPDHGVVWHIEPASTSTMLTEDGIYVALSISTDYPKHYSCRLTFTLLRD